MEITADAVGRDEVLALYDAVGWTAYTRDPDALMRAISGSHLVLTARQGGTLVGLLRTISDGAAVCYVQDLLVRPNAQRRGIGRALMTETMHRYADCRQFVLTTDADGPHEFYRSMGLVPAAESGLVAFLRA